jgi:hypothetical protein
MIDTDPYEPILTTMGAELLPIRCGRVVVDPAEIRVRINRFDFAGSPGRWFNRVEDAPSGVTEIGTGQSESPPRSVRPLLRHRVESHRYGNRLVAHSKNPWKPTASSYPQQHALDVQE